MRVLASLAASFCLLFAAAVGAQPAETSQNVVRAEAPIVAGNAVNAKKRALADAFRQATEQAFAELLRHGEPMPSPLPPGVAQIKASLANSAQKYVRSYRLVEEQTGDGMFKALVEVDVNEVLLRRDLDEARGQATVRTQPSARPMAKAMLVAGPAPAGAVMVAALGPEGVRAQLERAATEAQLLASAARQNAVALFVTARGAADERIRGVFLVPVTCRVAWRLFLPGAQAARGPVAQRTDEDHGFGDSERAALEGCLSRAAASAARAVAAALRTPVTSASFVTLQLEIADVGVIPVVLQACKRMGMVTATEVRRVTSRQVEIRIFTRVTGASLLQALGRELGGKLVLAPLQPPSDVIVARAQSPEAPPAPEENRVEGPSVRP